jgi:hypothetical protein
MAKQLKETFRSKRELVRLALRQKALEMQHRN